MTSEPGLGRGSSTQGLGRMLDTCSSKTLLQMFIKLGVHVSHTMKIQKQARWSTTVP